MAKNDRPIRIPNTALGTIWIECFEPEILHLHPWWHESCQLDGQKLPFFRVKLRRVKGVWTVAEFEDRCDREDAPKWPRGAAAKVPNLAVEIGAAWAAEHADVMHERAVSYLEDRIKYAPRGVDWIREAMAHAVLLDRLDLLEPIQPLIQANANEFSRVNRKLAARRRNERRKAA